MPDEPSSATEEPIPPSGRYMPPPPDSSPVVYNYGERTKAPRWVAPITIVVGSLIAGGIVAGAITVVSALPDVIDSGNEVFGPNPLVTGAPQSPLAVAPLDCENQCFTDDVVAATIIPQSRLDELGLTRVAEEWSDHDPSSAAWEYPYLKTEWQRLGSETESCFFTLPPFPLAAELDTAPAEGDLVEFTGTSTSTDEFTYFTQSVRIFPTSAQAVEHMSDINDLIGDCTYYAFDLQHANVVVRTIVSTVDVISETQYRDLVEELAATIAQLELPQKLT